MNKDAVAEISQPYQAETTQKLVPEGYKQTEVGVTNSSGANLNATCGGPKGGGMDSRRIPEGWRCLPFEDALTIRHGRDQKPVESINGKYPIFGTGGQMGWAMEYLYDKPSVLIGRKGSINKPRYMETPFWTVDTLFYSEIKSGFNAKFIFYKFCMINWEQYNEASGVPSLNSRTIEKVTALFPTFKEQCIIANALSDVDALLSELEKLIAKKQAIKTATMQQLLTGRTRLPQFAHHPDGSKKGYKQSELGEIPEDWEVVEFSAVVEKIVGGGTPSRSNPAYWGNDIPWVTVKDFATFSPFTAQEKITKLGLQNSSSNLISSGTLITSTRMALGKAVIYKVDVAINQDLKAIFTSRNLETSFLCFWFENNAQKIEELGSGSTVKGLSLTDLRKIPFLLQSMEEQAAIATILADMDAEIQALEHRLNKTREIKQGMMQELLTGKTRLIKGGKNV
ncbi:MAG: restriction endonuclease subunit S [Atribacterota bacterium]|jgi:type I restriction enzyme S subunit|nr:restriction endonuclease subunit S [Atribacterota bacterium]